MNKNNHPQKKFMLAAIDVAKKESKKYGEWKFGAVVVKDNKIISKSGNRVFRDIDPSGHAEICAMKLAAKKLGTKYLHNCVLYTTNEPCCMCVGAAVWAEMDGIVFGANSKDLEKEFKKQKNPNMFIIPAAEILKKQGTKKMFLIRNFMRMECKNLHGW